MRLVGKLIAPYWKNFLVVKNFKWCKKNNNIRVRGTNNESSEVIDILLPVTFYFNPSTRLDNVPNF